VASLCSAEVTSWMQAQCRGDWWYLWEGLFFVRDGGGRAGHGTGAGSGLAGCDSGRDRWAVGASAAPDRIVVWDRGRVARRVPPGVTWVRRVTGRLFVTGLALSFPALKFVACSLGVCVTRTALLATRAERRCSMCERRAVRRTADRARGARRSPCAWRLAGAWWRQRAGAGATAATGRNGGCSAERRPRGEAACSVAARRWRWRRLRAGF